MRDEENVPVWIIISKCHFSCSYLACKWILRFFLRRFPTFKYRKY